MTFLPPIVIIIVYFGFHTWSNEVLLIIYLSVLAAVVFSISFTITILFFFSLFPRGRKAFDWSVNYPSNEPISTDVRIGKIEQKVQNLATTEDLAKVEKRVENIEEKMGNIEPTLNKILREIKQGKAAGSRKQKKKEQEG
jgi:hypothetical protein